MPKSKQRKLNTQWERVHGTFQSDKLIARQTEIKDTQASQFFKDACRVAGIPITHRQASRFSRQFGAAWVARLKVPK